MHKVAVLIPLYNVERYVERALDSVLAQTHPDFAVFCCDDGSTDATRAIVGRIAARDARVRLTVQANTGANAARNRLLDELPAEFDAFAFMDGDDMMHPRMLAELDAALTRTGAEVAECQSVSVAADAARPVEVGPVDPARDRVIEDLSIYLLRRTSPGAYASLWTKLHLRSAVSGIRLRPELTYEDDFIYGYEVNAAIHRKVLIRGAFYNYRNNPTGVTSRLDLRRYFESAAGSVRIRLFEFAQAGRVPPRLLAAFYRDLSADLYRMCIRKNLRKNRDAKSRRELFRRAGELLQELEREAGFRPVGLGLIPRFVCWWCRQGR